MPASKKRINIELHLSLSATFLSLAALIVAIFQTKIAREQQQKSVLPYLQIRHEMVNNSLRIILENKGVGPAFVHDIRMLHKKQTAQEYNSFVLGQLDKGLRKLNYLDTHSSEAVIRQQIARDSQMIIARDWFEGSKKTEIVEAGTALKEGDQMLVYEWQQKGYVGGPFLQYTESLIADSTYQIRIVYKDVYNNCWQLVHKHNRNNVTSLDDCPK